MEYSEMDEMSRDILMEVGNIGTGHLVTALSAMTGYTFEVDVSELRIVKYQDVPRLLGGEESLKTGIMLKIKGDLSGIFMFLMDEDFARLLIKALSGVEPEGSMSNMDDMERSAVCEVGNVICCSYINAIASLTEMDIRVSVPDLCTDMAGAILSVPMIYFANIGDELLLIENQFCVKGCSFTSHVLFLPELDSLEKMLKALGG